MLAGDQIRALFAQEADERLKHLGQLLLELEQRNDDPQIVDAIFREMHTIKGSAAIAELEDVSRQAHAMEELVGDIRAGRRTISAELIDTLLEGTDRLSASIAAGTAPPQPPPDAAAPPRSPAQAVVGDHAGETPAPAPVRTPASPARTATVSAQGSVAAVVPTDNGHNTVMVPTERLDELDRLVGEMAAAHLRLGSMLTGRFAVDPASCTEYNELSRAVNELQDRTMRTRMVPIATITDRLHRAVRDLARTQDKQIRWHTVGVETELDRGVLHQLSDSLLHLVRNAVDHGIETPAERRAADKPVQGTVQLRATQLGSEVTIEVSDDGRGIDVPAVRQQASRQGISVDGLTDEELLRLTLRSGLSTSAFVTDVSGRGVGLDVVRTNVEAARGRVEVESRPGGGSAFRVVVPITLAVLRCLLVEAGGQRFALPLHRVVLTRLRSDVTRTSAEGRQMIMAEGRPVPLSDLGTVLGCGPEQPADDGPVVVVADAMHQYAFGVDRLLGQRDVVVKGLSKLLPHLPVVAGASVESDGTLLLVLDPPGLVELARSAGRPGIALAKPTDSEPVRSRVLVVDDALTIRELQRSILERAGFDVIVATNGSQAMALLGEQRADLVLTDIEMPVMDGFALTEAIRASPTLSNTPVLILSSLASEASRRRGLDAGADGYIVKSGFDEEGLLTAVNRLIGGRA